MVLATASERGVVLAMASERGVVLATASEREVVLATASEREVVSAMASEWAVGHLSDASRVVRQLYKDPMPEKPLLLGAVPSGRESSYRNAEQKCISQAVVLWRSLFPSWSHQQPRRSQRCCLCT